MGRKGRGKGLTAIAQQGIAAILADYLKTLPEVKAVYALSAPTTTVLLPQVGSANGGIVSQELKVTDGDRLAIANMYGFSMTCFYNRR